MERLLLLRLFIPVYFSISISILFLYCLRYSLLSLHKNSYVLLNKVDVLHVRLTELHAAHQNLPPAIRSLRLKETIQNIPKTNEI